MIILKEEGVEVVGGIMYCFIGSVEVVRECMKMNFYLLFGGLVIFKNVKKLKEVVKEILNDWLLIEIDCLFFIFYFFCGKRNELSYVKYVVE